MENSLGFSWFCLLIGNMWIIASYLVDNPFLVFGGFLYLFLGLIALLISHKSDFRIRMLERKLEWQKYETIVKLLEQIAGKKKIKTKTPIKK